MDIINNINRKIAFFDIDGTLTSEIDSSIPESVLSSIGKARQNGHLMFINTGRCFQNVEERFKKIGFDGYVCGCGTDIYIETDSGLKEILEIHQSNEITKKILLCAGQFEADLLFESKYEVAFDRSHPFYTKEANDQFLTFCRLGYNMERDLMSEDFFCDKFVVWFKHTEDISEFCKFSDRYFYCIDRGENFREFVPHNYSKATGIKKLKDYYMISDENVYAFGDSNNDLSMLLSVKNSIAMGNSYPVSLFDNVSFVTSKASENGIENALKHFGFI